MGDKDTAAAYRKRAEELRRIALNFQHEGAQRDLLTVADT